MSLANKAFDILIGKGFTKIFRIVCQNFSKYTFGTQNEYLCDVVTEAVENGIKFLEKYIPVMTCRWASLCTVMESLKYVSSPRSLNTNLTCKQCTDTLSIFKREFGDKVIEYQDFSCFLLNSIFETHTACRLIKEENGRSAAIKFFNRLFQQLRITNQACDCSNEVFSEVSREEEVNYFFEQLSNLFSSFILE